MELRQLRYFVKVASLKSFSEASKELFITQSTLSQQIKQLENELGVELLTRDSRHVDLSPYGEQFLPFAIRTIQDAQASIDRIKDVQNLNTGQLTVGSTYTYGPLLKQTALSFSRLYPGIRLNIICLSMEELMKKLKNNEIDLALSFRPLGHYPDIESTVIFKCHLSFVVSNQNPLSSLKSIKLTDLQNYPLVLPSNMFQDRDLLDILLFGHNFNLDVRMEINDPGALIDLVADSDLATVLSDTAVISLKRFSVIPIDDPNCEIEACYHTRKGSYIKKSANEFLTLLMENNSSNLAEEGLKQFRI